MLAPYDADYSRRINAALEQDLDAWGGGIRTQLDSLIVKPFGPVTCDG